MNPAENTQARRPMRFDFATRPSVCDDRPMLRPRVLAICLRSASFRRRGRREQRQLQERRQGQRRNRQGRAGQASRRAPHRLRWHAGGSRARRSAHRRRKRRQRPSSRRGLGRQRGLAATAPTSRRRWPTSGGSTPNEYRASCRGRRTSRCTTSRTTVSSRKNGKMTDAQRSCVMTATTLAGARVPGPRSRQQRTAVTRQPRSGWRRSGSASA